jgi:hypothetical protein
MMAEVAPLLVKGTCWPAFGGLCTESRAVALIREMETQLRPTDVWLATFPKCGTTWVHQICLLLLNGGDSSAWYERRSRRLTDGCPPRITLLLAFHGFMRLLYI